MILLILISIKILFIGNISQLIFFHLKFFHKSSHKCFYNFKYCFYLFMFIELLVYNNYA